MEEDGRKRDGNASWSGINGSDGAEMREEEAGEGVGTRLPLSEGRAGTLDEDGDISSEQRKQKE